VLSASLGLQSLGLTATDAPPAACANEAPCIAAANHTAHPLRLLETDMFRPALASDRSFSRDDDVGTAPFARFCGGRPLAAPR